MRLEMVVQNYSVKSEKFKIILLEAGQYIYKEDDPSDSTMYFVLSGELLVQKKMDGSPVSINTLRPGDFFGEASLLTMQPRRETVRAISPKSKLMVLPKNQFPFLIETNQPMVYSIYKSIISKFIRIEKELQLLLKKLPKTDLSLLEKLYNARIKVTSRDTMNFLDTLPHRVMKKGELLFAPSSPSDGIMYYILSGSLEVVKAYNQFNSIRVPIQSGKFFGEGCLLSNIPRDVQVITTSDTVVVTIDEQNFQKICSIHFNFLFTQIKFIIWKLDTAQRILDYIENKIRYKTAHSDVKSLKQKTTIMKEGEPSNQSMFFILEGECSVFKNINGKQEQVNTISKGDFFGELALVSEENRNATIRVASETAKVIQLKRERFAEKTSTNPGFMFSILKSIIVRLYRAETRLFHEVNFYPSLPSNQKAKAEATRIKLLEAAQKIKGQESLYMNFLEKVYSQEDFSNIYCYILMEGEIKLTAKKDYRDIILTTLYPGNILSEVSLIGRFPLLHTATVQSERVELLPISREDFLRIIEEVPDFLYEFLSSEIWKLLPTEKVIIDNKIQYDIYQKES